MRNKMILFLMLFSSGAVASDGFRFSTQTQDLFTESHVVAIQKESSVQNELGGNGAHHAGVFAGLLKIQGATIEGTQKKKTYSEVNFPVVGIRYARTFWGDRLRLGWECNLQYSFFEDRQKEATTLHLVPVSVGFLGRYGEALGWSIQPIFGFGPQGMAFVQRGVEGLETSGMDTTYYSNLGIVVPLFEKNELLVRYQKTFWAQEANRDWRGDSLILGGSMTF